MAPVLEPTFVFPLEAPPDAMPVGRVNEPGLMFAGSPPMLYVTEPVWNATWGRWLGWHSPTVAASVFFATVLAAVWWMRRVGKWPRQVGRMYCRVCNHQLAKPQLVLNEKQRAVWADAEAKCPECGVRHKRGPVRGRLRFTRMLPVLLVSPVVMLICGLVLLATLRFYQRSAWSGGTWPTAGIDKLFGSWALERRGISMNQQSTRLWCIDPRTNLKEEIGPIDSWNLTLREFVSPDGRFAVATEDNARRMLVIDLRTREHRVYSPEPASSSYFTMGRFAKDGRRVLVEKATYRDSGMLHELLTFEPATGKFVTVASVELPQVDRAAGVYTTTNFEFGERPERIAWVHVTKVQNATGRNEKATLRWEVDGKQMERAESSVSGGLRVNLSKDGKACIVSDVMSRSTKAFDFMAGEDLATVPLMGEHEDRDLAGPRMPGFASNGVMMVMAMKGQPRVVGEVLVTTQTWQAVGSADGRFASASKERDLEPSWIGVMLGMPPTKALAVRMWDFEKLLDAETELPIGAAASKNSTP